MRLSALPDSPTLPFRSAFLGAIVWVLVAVSLPVEAQRVSREQLLDFMQQIRSDNDLPGLSVAVAVDGELVFSEGVGFAELDNRTPATGRTVHNAGSVSKVLAVVGLMQLWEQGKVDLDATIQTYLP